MTTNGVYDSSEPPLPGVMVSLYSTPTLFMMRTETASATLIQTTTTDANGFYTFTNVMAGVYYIHFALPSGFNYTIAGTDMSANASGDTPDFVVSAGGQTVVNSVGAIRAPTAIELAGFYAVTTSAAKCGNASGAECVSVFWQTLREADTAGFVLLRGDGLDSHADVREVSGFIQSEGSGGANYAWQDTSTQAGHAYAYWLRELQTDGRTRDFGPVYVWVEDAVR
jgi:hypothetical protein